MPTSDLPVDLPLSPATGDLQFSADGAHLAGMYCIAAPTVAAVAAVPACAEQRIAVWDLAGQSLVQSVGPIREEAAAFQFAPDGQSLIVLGPHRVSTWGLASGQMEGAFHDDSPYALGVAAGFVLDDQQIIYLRVNPTNGHGRELVTRDFATGRTQTLYRSQPGSVFDAFAASRDGQWLAVSPCALAGQRDCPEAPDTAVLNLATGAPAHTLAGQRVVAFTPDSQALVTDEVDGGGRVVTSLWRAGRWEAYAQLAVGEGEALYALSGDGAYLAVASGAQVSVWAVDSGQLVAQQSIAGAGVARLAVSPGVDAARVAVYTTDPVNPLVVLTLP